MVNVLVSVGFAIAISTRQPPGSFLRRDILSPGYYSQDSPHSRNNSRAFVAFSVCHVNSRVPRRYDGIIVERNNGRCTVVGDALDSLNHSFVAAKQSSPRSGRRLVISSLSPFHAAISQYHVILCEIDRFLDPSQQYGSSRESATSPTAMTVHVIKPSRVK